MGQTTTYKLPWFKMTRYSVGFGGGSIMSALMASFITSYYTDTVLLNAAAIGTMYLIARVFDGISDFVKGVVMDFSWIGVIVSIILTILILMMDVEKKVVKLQAEKKAN